MSSASPTISVILPVYNAGHYIHDAIKSILNQTYTDFEFIIINDGSKDDSESAIQQYHDPRIRFYSQENQGLTHTLNRLVSLAQGKYIARMDQDDWSAPDRLARQIQFLENHPDVGLVGAWVEVYDPADVHLGVHRYPITDSAIKEMLIVKNTFAHGTIMMRSDTQVSYRKAYDYAEDFDRWCQMAQVTKFANLPYVLYRWRTSPGGMSAKFAQAQAEARHRILKEYRSYYLKTFAQADLKLSDVIEVTYRGKLRVIFAKMKIALTLLRLGKFSTGIKKLGDIIRVIALSSARIAQTRNAVQLVP